MKRPCVSTALLFFLTINSSTFAADDTGPALPDLKLRLTTGSSVSGRELDIFRNKDGQMVATIGPAAGSTRCILNNNPVKLEPLTDDIVRVTFLPKENDDPKQLC